MTLVLDMTRGCFEVLHFHMTDLCRASVETSDIFHRDLYRWLTRSLLSETSNRSRSREAINSIDIDICRIFIPVFTLMSNPISLSTIQANYLTALCEVCSDALVLVDDITLEWFRLTNLIGQLFCSADRPTIRRITDSVKRLSVHV
jgi:hypothetical protein